jgi:hypothetical protein
MPVSAGLTARPWYGLQGTKRPHSLSTLDAARGTDDDEAGSRAESRGHAGVPIPPEGVKRAP